jgi:hypothetical protein
VPPTGVGTNRFVAHGVTALVEDAEPTHSPGPIPITFRAERVIESVPKGHSLFYL